MRIQEIINKKTKEKVIIFGGEDIVLKQPYEHYFERCLLRKMSLLAPNEMFGEIKPTKEGAKFLVQSLDECKEYINNFRKIELPENLKKLLVATKKKEQEKLLKGFEITTDILMAFILYAGDNGYLFSEYSSEHSPNSFQENKFPLAYIQEENGAIKKMGMTDLTDGQLKQNLEQRIVKVAKILEKEDNWHCFFLTYKSLAGKENWNNGQPHFHYISNLFGLTKEHVIEQIKAKDYKLGNLPHIAIKDYGIQPE